MQMTYAERDFLRRITFIQMRTASHYGDGQTTKIANDQLACVADCGGSRKARDIRIGRDYGVGEFVGEVAKAAAEEE